jgi:hypothetical protein
MLVNASHREILGVHHARAISQSVRKCETWVILHKRRKTLIGETWPALFTRKNPPPFDIISRRDRRTAEDIIEIGRDLIALKAKLPHGSFGAWLEKEFEFSEMHAQRFMRVAEKFGDNVRYFAHPSSKALSTKERN